jgi:cell division protein FtsL
MIKVLISILTLTVLGSAFQLYSLEYSKQAAKRDIARIEKRIGEVNESTQLLKAERSNLMRPQRIQELARRHLDLHAVSQLQYLNVSELGSALPEPTPAQKASQSEDPVGSLMLELAE